MFFSKARSHAMSSLKKNLQNALLVAFFSEIFITILGVYVSKIFSVDMLEDLFSGTLPILTSGQLKTYFILFALVVVFTPLLSFGAMHYFLQTCRGKETNFTMLFSFFKKPFRAWFSYIALYALYALWILVPAILIFALHIFSSQFFTSSLTYYLLSLLYIPYFYAKLRYFAFLYVRTDENLSIKASIKKSRELTKNYVFDLLLMLIYFSLIYLALNTLGLSFTNFGILGLVLAQVLTLLFKSWMMMTFASVYTALNNEDITTEENPFIGEDEFKKMLIQKFMQSMQEEQEKFNEKLKDEEQAQQEHKSDDCNQEETTTENTQTYAEPPKEKE